jgi:hypothetical protein
MAKNHEGRINIANEFNHTPEVCYFEKKSRKGKEDQEKYAQMY